MILVQGTTNNGITIAIHATIRIAPLIKVEISLLNTTITHFVDSNGDKKKKAGSLPSTRQLEISIIRETRILLDELVDYTAL